MKNTASLLLMDDHAGSHAATVTVLTQAGYEVFTAGGGGHALAMVGDNLPDLILLGGGPTALEVCRQLKACADTRHIPVVFINAFSDIQERVAALQAGATDCIAQPCQPPELLARIKNLLLLVRSGFYLEEKTAALQQALDRLRSEIESRQQMENELRRSLDRAERARLAMLSALEDQKHTESSLLELSRQNGMAEVATSVLHNVGNVLNSVNVSANLVQDRLGKSKISNLRRIGALLAAHTADLAEFLTHDPQGRCIPGYLGTLADQVAAERKAVAGELTLLRTNIDHIKDIVAMQQSCSKSSGVIEPVPLHEVVEDALRLNSGSLGRHDLKLVRDFQVRPVVKTDKHKILQILINLLRNAKLACDESGRTDKQVAVRITGDRRTARVSVTDNGVGVPPENLTRIFSHGFTTRKEGHGYALHSGALFAKELGGSLLVQSEGTGRGATFILELPCENTVLP